MVTSGGGKKNSARRLRQWSPTWLLRSALGGLTLIDRTGNRVLHRIWPNPVTGLRFPTSAVRPGTGVPPFVFSKASGFFVVVVVLRLRLRLREARHARNSAAWEQERGPVPLHGWAGACRRVRLVNGVANGVATAWRERIGRIFPRRGQNRNDASARRVLVLGGRSKAQGGAGMRGHVGQVGAGGGCGWARSWSGSEGAEKRNSGPARQRLTMGSWKWARWIWRRN